MGSTAVQPAGPDARNTLTGRHALALRRYVALVIALGALVVLLVSLRLHVGAHELEPELFLLAGLVLLSELRPLLTAGSRDEYGVMVSTAFLFALLLRYGLPAAVLMQVAATVAADLLKHRALWRTSFNAAQYALSWTAAAAAMRLVGHHASLADPMALDAPGLVAVVVGALVYFVVNELLVAKAIALKTGAPVLQLLRDDAGYEVLTTTALLALAPLVCLAVDEGPAFVPLLLPPLLAVYAAGSVAVDRERQALSDALTGLPNRTLFAERTAEALREGPVALVLMDLDRFKEVNDTLGHHVGDRLLQAVAERLTLAVRPGDTVARLGGDEFALVLPGLPDEAAALELAGRLRLAVSAPVLLEGVLLDVHASAGVALSPDHGTKGDALLQHADVAMYLSKESGEVEVYDALRDPHSTSRLAMLGELRQALCREELQLHYQPEVCLRTGEVVAVEALVRWRHPERGLVPPEEFVPLAERSGLVQDLTAWVLDAALRQLALWHRQGLPLRLAVNVSVRDLVGVELAGQVEDGLLRYGVPAARLQLEVTEGSLLADPVRAAGTIARLQQLGVGLSLDDFGTGFSSLSHLRGLPVGEIKVDRSFVQRMADPKDLAVVRSVVELGQGLGMTVVAEGVEDAVTLERLVDVGCDVVQGLHVCGALPARELTSWLRERAAVPTLRPAAARR